MSCVIVKGTFAFTGDGHISFHFLVQFPETNYLVEGLGKNSILVVRRISFDFCFCHNNESLEFISDNDKGNYGRETTEGLVQQKLEAMAAVSWSHDSGGF